ncbi:MAG: YifB family Mg chelatase-like AAA ATPase [Longimicrobiales bacterium]|nr:YifB family Mg chelatase-like AAA ATPase [Longimicrobiales bacterium]
MFVHVHTATVRGIDAFQVRVEVNLAPGLPSFAVVGLAQGSVREGRERVGAALRNSGFGLPSRRITVNLAPADVRKAGTAFDLPIAVGILAAAGSVPVESLTGVGFVGELGLDGAIRPVPGVLSVALACRRQGLSRLVVPAANLAEARLVEDVEVVEGHTLEQVVRLLAGEAEGCAPGGVEASAAESPSAAAPDSSAEGQTSTDRRNPTGDVSGAVVAQSGEARPRATPLDLADVRGQETAKRALEISAAGGHNLLMVGPPGAGKTMLARRLPGILPPLKRDEAIEVAQVHSVAGLLLDGALPRSRPFRAPHHSISYAGLHGGGSPLRPGEVSLAHRGVLFLDELPEFRRDALEMLRQPLEEGCVRLSRAGSWLRFPSRILLVAAMNPCPCGFHGDASDRCTCDPGTIARYRARVSGPLLDRLDLRVTVPPVPVAELVGSGRGEPSTVVSERVVAARGRQTRRFEDHQRIRSNADMTPALLRRRCRVSDQGHELLLTATHRSSLSARGVHRVLRVARTIADLEGSTSVGRSHVAEALHFRSVAARGRAA